MDPIRTVNSNFTYRGPSDDIGDLPCERHTELGKQTEVYSVWELTDEERQAIAAGGQLKLGVMTPDAIPPVSFEVVKEDKL